MRIAATEEARRSREIRARLPTPTHVAVAEACARFSAAPAFGEDADPQGFVTLHCPRGKAADLADWLLAHGAERVTVTAVEQMFDKRNPLWDALVARIGTA
jgi:ATP phosphoribosyltransferase